MARLNGFPVLAAVGGFHFEAIRLLELRPGRGKPGVTVSRREEGWREVEDEVDWEVSRERSSANRRGTGTR